MPRMITFGAFGLAIVCAINGAASQALSAITPTVVNNFANLNQPAFDPSQGMSVNQLLCGYTPGTAAPMTYPGVPSTTATFPAVVAPIGTLSQNVGPQGWGGWGQAPVASTQLYKPSTGNQTNVKGVNSKPVFIAGATCSQTSAQASSAGACVTNATGALYPLGVNPVPAGTVVQGVVFYASSNSHMYIMDPFYPFASVWVFGASCVGFIDGVSVGQLVQITLPVSANLIISGPTYDSPKGMLGLGGALDQGAYTAVADNEWVLMLNMAASVPNYVAGNATNPALCPGLTLLSAAGAYPYAPGGGLFQCGPAQDTTRKLVPNNVANAKLAPPPPRLSFQLPPSIQLPSNCLTVEQYLCQYTSSNSYNNQTAPNGVTPGGTICGVWFFGTGTGNAYIQDPFSPYTSIWLTNGPNAGLNSTLLGNQALPAFSINSDGGTDSYTIGVDAGYTTGMYLAYTYANSQIAYSKAASSPIFQIQMNGVYFNKVFCNYTGSDTVSSCPPTNCQLATCNSRNIQANYGADYCTGQTVTGPTPSNTVGCGIQVLATNWPVLGPGPPSNAAVGSAIVTNPTINIGFTQCPDSSKPLGLPPTQTIYISSVVAVGGYTAAKFLAADGLNVFEESVAQVIMISGPSRSIPGVPSQAGLLVVSSNVTITGVLDAPPGVVGRRRQLLQATGTSWVLVNYTVAIPSGYSQSVRTYLSVLTQGLAFANVLKAMGLTQTVDTEMISAPIFSGIVPIPEYVYVPGTSASGCLAVRTPAACKGAIAGLVIGLTLCVCITMVASYFLYFKRKAREEGQKSAVYMTQMPVPTSNKA